MHRRSEQRAGGVHHDDADAAARATTARERHAAEAVRLHATRRVGTGECPRSLRSKRDSWLRELRQVDTWLFHIPSDPTESHNLAASDAAQLAKMVRWYQQYQKTAVDDLAITKCPNGFMAKCADPKGNPGLRPDKAWGPFLGSTECKWE